MRGHSYTLLWVASIAFIALIGPAAAQDTKRIRESPFAGDYVGKFTFKASHPGLENQKGQITFSINSRGKVTGEAKNTTINKTADLKGTVDADGELKLVIEFADERYTAKGTVTMSKKGNLRGTLTEYLGKLTLGRIEFDLPPD